MNVTITIGWLGCIVSKLHGCNYYSKMTRMNVHGWMHEVVTKVQWM